MHVCQRLDASLDRLLQEIGRIGLRQVNGRLHRRQHVLDAVLGFAREQGNLRFVAFALADVAGDLGGADDRALRILDGRDGQRNIDQAAIFALAHGLVVLDALARADALDDGVFFALQIGWDQGLDRFADHLFGQIAENPLRALVPAGDDAVEVLADDGVVGGFDDRRKMLQRAFGALPLRHVDEHVDGADQRAGGVVERRRIRQERNAGAVGPLGDRVHAAHRALFLERDRHRALVMRQQPAVRPEQLPRAAPLALAELGPAAP